MGTCTGGCTVTPVPSVPTSVGTWRGSIRADPLRRHVGVGVDRGVLGSQLRVRRAWLLGLGVDVAGDGVHNTHAAQTGAADATCGGGSLQRRAVVHRVVHSTVVGGLISVRSSHGCGAGHGSAAVAPGQRVGVHEVPASAQDLVRLRVIFLQVTKTIGI